ncbi:hypothetical protein NEOLI_000274 [Neolecta irregularis DAH-3]|uniref:RSE1/DDB1/CPSF1 first beta-propeller domain-containing protein n=1 Tax=Neolecta irregularis (strain DAH-3) TaxID=1198029 RepID=A0A1U7LVF4_NEOID|nr:hypothetical protein NEOLI_000274 [Neolecta irregularis DAH-3]|eukprot:OLL26553.1 hypothetical protein NEOLI_000274 [Neolecta irregularis DAH-3]
MNPNKHQLLHHTIAASPQIKFALSGEFRYDSPHDLVLIKHHAIEFYELQESGELICLSNQFLPFGIQDAKVYHPSTGRSNLELGLQQTQEKVEIGEESFDVDMIVCSTDTGKLLYLTWNDNLPCPSKYANGGKLHPFELREDSSFHQEGYFEIYWELCLGPVGMLGSLGKEVSVDPLSRAVAVSAWESYVAIHIPLKYTNAKSQPLHVIEVGDLIWHAVFLYPQPGREERLLLAIYMTEGHDYLRLFEWFVGRPIHEFHRKGSLPLQQGGMTRPLHLLSLASEPEAFVLITKTKIFSFTAKDIISGNIEPQEEQLLPDSIGILNAISRCPMPNRTWESFWAISDLGTIVKLTFVSGTLDRESLAFPASLDNNSQHILPGSVLVSIPVDSRTVDILFVGGDASDSALYLLEHDSFGSSGHPNLIHLSSIPSWGAVRDAVIAPPKDPGNELSSRNQALLFVASGFDNAASVSRLQIAHQGSVVHETEIQAENLWSLIHAEQSLLIISTPWGSQAMTRSCSNELEGCSERVGLLEEEPTLAAESWNTILTQITPSQIRLSKATFDERSQMTKISLTDTSRQYLVADVCQDLIVVVIKSTPTPKLAIARSVCESGALFIQWTQCTVKLEAQPSLVRIFLSNRFENQHDYCMVLVSLHNGEVLLFTVSRRDVPELHLSAKEILHHGIAAQSVSQYHHRPSIIDHAALLSNHYRQLLVLGSRSGILILWELFKIDGFLKFGSRIERMIDGNPVHLDPCYTSRYQPWTSCLVMTADTQILRLDGHLIAIATLIIQPTGFEKGHQMNICGKSICMNEQKFLRVTPFKFDDEDNRHYQSFASVSEKDNIRTLKFIKIRMRNTILVMKFYLPISNPKRMIYSSHLDLLVLSLNPSSTSDQTLAQERFAFLDPRSGHFLMQQEEGQQAICSTIIGLNDLITSMTICSILLSGSLENVLVVGLTNQSRSKIFRCLVFNISRGGSRVYMNTLDEITCNGLVSEVVGIDEYGIIAICSGCDLIFYRWISSQNSFQPLPCGPFRLRSAVIRFHYSENVLCAVLPNDPTTLFKLQVGIMGDDGIPTITFCMHEGYSLAPSNGIALSSCGSGNLVQANRNGTVIFWSNVPTNQGLSDEVIEIQLKSRSIAILPRPERRDILTVAINGEITRIISLSTFQYYLLSQIENARSQENSPEKSLGHSKDGGFWVENGDFLASIRFNFETAALIKSLSKNEQDDVNELRKALDFVFP